MRCKFSPSELSKSLILMSVIGLLRSGGAIAPIEREQTLPVPLGRVAMIDRALGKGEAVMGARIDFDLGVGACHACFHLLDDLHRRVDVGFGTGEIKFGPGLLC